MSTESDVFKCGFVAIVGRPNAGKSTLTNAWVSEKVSAVTPVPQTTRNRILGIANRPDAQVILMDTPGIHKPFSHLNRQMMSCVRSALESRDLAVLVVDASSSFGRGDQFALDLLRPYRVPTILALNKTDKMRKDRLLPLISRYASQYDFEEVFPVSALSGDGLEAMLGAVIRRLPQGPALFPKDYYTDQPERFLAAEMIREKVILHTRKELPYATAVLIDEFHEDDRITRIHATILVERESQKPIVIGAEGGLIKKIGIEARHDLEKLFPPQVFLSLRVRVEPHWRDSQALVASLDYRNESA
ncbi:MAG: GTPase Era [Acidobacteriota bacterium]|nr:GTPase Era [Acidobacteriota bacterium]